MSLRRTGCALLACLGAVACAGHPLSFRRAAQITILSPSMESVVQVPVMLRWASSLPRGTVYAVFVDRAPIQPGRTLKSLALNDSTCDPNPHCPDTLYLTQHDTFVTKSTQLSLGPLPFLGNHDRLNVHDATIIVLDASGRRRDEASYSVRFRVTPSGRGAG
ncbi:MAG: hypothetical protein ACYDH6_20310 [Acidimicrobiales bacterium]